MPGPQPDVRKEIQRLRKAGVADLAVRPDRYPNLARQVHEWALSHNLMDLTSTARVMAFWRRVLSHVEDPSLREAAFILFQMDGTTAPPLDDRRRSADRAYRRVAESREPDTIRRDLEVVQLDPLLAQILDGRAIGPPISSAGETASDQKDLHAWEDDLYSAHALFSRQEFRPAELILAPYIGAPSRLVRTDAHPELLARSMELVGDIARDQGHLVGPSSAARWYAEAQSIWRSIGAVDRVLRLDLMAALLREMSGDLVPAERAYRKLQSDDRLSPRHRTLALLWSGTALTKIGVPSEALMSITLAMNQMEDSGAEEAWHVARQKKALAILTGGDPLRALNELTDDGFTPGTPLGVVRRSAALSHVLLSTPATRQEGANLLADTRALAIAHQLHHQERSMEILARQFDL